MSSESSAGSQKGEKPGHDEQSLFPSLSTKSKKVKVTVLDVVVEVVLMLVGAGCGIYLWLLNNSR